jgi:hypothetical protein
LHHRNRREQDNNRIVAFPVMLQDRVGHGTGSRALLQLKAFIPTSHLLATIDKERRECQYKNLSSAIRLYVLDYYQQQVERGAVP